MQELIVIVTDRDGRETATSGAFLNAEPVEREERSHETH